VPLPKSADLRKKVGAFYFFTITYSLFTKSNRRFLEAMRALCQYFLLNTVKENAK